MEFHGYNTFVGSASQLGSDDLILVSRCTGKKIDLMLIACLSGRKGTKAILREQLELAMTLKPLDAREVRKNISSSWGALMTKHLMHVQEELDMDDSDIVAFTAWKYETLTSWGEASAAREISLELKTSIHTIHYRLKLARDRGILASPGPGSRLGI
jgi:hypothetical protein